MDDSRHPATAGWGMLEAAQPHGLLLHSTVRVPPNRVPVGWLAHPGMYREPTGLGKQHRRPQRPSAAQASRQGLARLRATAHRQAACPARQRVRVGDRAAAGYAVVVLSRELPQDGLVRAAWPRAGDPAEPDLGHSLAPPPVGGTGTVPVPRPGTPPGRTATRTGPCAAVTLQPPRHRAAAPLPGLRGYGVLARDRAPPAGVERSAWVRLPTVPVGTWAAAGERMQWYTCRWGIAIEHHVRQSGCRLANRQVATAARLER